MFYLFIVAVITLLMIIGIFCYFIVTNKKNSNKKIIIVLVFLVISLGIIAYCIEPKITNDLYRHFRDVDIIRTKGIDNANNYNNLLFIKLLFAFVSFLPNNHFLPAIAALITYGNLIYILCDFYKREEKKHTRVIAISILLNFSLCTFYMTVSGIRNAMACSLLALGLYLDLIREEKLVKKIWPYIIAPMIHPIAYIIIGIRVLFNIKLVEKFKYLFIMVALLYKPLINLFDFINIGITNYLANKMKAYLIGESIEDIRWITVISVFLIFIYVITILLKKKDKNIEFKKYLEFIQVYICLIFGLLFVAQIYVKRLTFLFAFFIIPLIYLIEEKFDKKNKWIIYSIIIFFLCGLIPYSVVELKNTGFIFLSK